MVMNWSMPFITLLLSSYHLWLGFLNLTRTNTLFLFSCFTLPRYKAFPKWEVRCLKILLKFLFHIIGSILHFRPWFYNFLGFSVPFMPSIFLINCMVYRRHKCDGGSGCPWSCSIMVKFISWAYFFLRW